MQRPGRSLIVRHLDELVFTVRLEDIRQDGSIQICFGLGRVNRVVQLLAQLRQEELGFETILDLILFLAI